MNANFPLRPLAVFVGVLLLTPAPVLAADPQTLADRIDRLLESRWPADQIKPALQADDAEFLRRASLDITGRIPTPHEVRAFLADTAPDQRARLVDRLIDSPRAGVHFANTWRSRLLPEIDANREARTFQPGFEAWLRQQWQAGVGYDRMVRDLLAAPIGTGRPALRDPESPNPVAFLAVKEAKPENLAAATARTFLGVQMECAQCHDHPFAKWTQDQFWQQAAFFAGLKQQGEGMFAPLTEDVAIRELTPINGKKAIRATFLDGARLDWDREPSGRAALAAWVTSRDNPFFARAGANRVWAQMFGVGLVDPPDDFRDDNPPFHAELLAELTKAFAESEFDVRYLTRAIARTRAYGRSSIRSDASQDDVKRFARMTVKSLTAEQFFDSLSLATGHRDADDKGQARRQFLERFLRTGPPAEPETSVSQALSLMNGRFIDGKTAETSPMLTALMQTPGLTTADRVEAMYLATLSRQPTTAERERMLGYITRGGTGREAERLGDVFWVLLNGAEFRLNH